MTRYRFAGCELDTDAFELRRDGHVQRVEPQVFDVLLHLLLNRGRTVTKEELLDSIWGDRFVSESALTSRIKSVRSACGDTGKAQQVVKTVHGRGYRFVADVEVHDDGAPARAAPTPAAPGPPIRDVVTRYATYGGGSTAFQVIGDGDVDVVFVPGFVSNVELSWDTPPFAEFFGRLSAHCRLVVFDKRGTGLSDRLAPDEVLTLEERMADLEHVMDAAGVERAALFGISEGGAMAALMAATHPERVSKLILANSYARIDWADREVIEAFLDRLERDWGSGNMIGRFLAPSWAGNDHLHRLCARYERHSATPATAASYLRLSLNHLDVTDVLPAVQAPTLVLHRQDDRLVAVEAASVLAEGIPDAELRILPGGDHLVFAGDTDDVLGPVEEFLAVGAPATAPTERVLATVLFADIVGSTERALRLGDARWCRQLEHFHEEAARIVARYEGRLVSTAGDGFVATFSGPARAARAGLEVRDAMRGRDLELRTGVHTAEIELRADDIAGIGVHIGARVADLAEPGEVWVSRTVRDLTAGSGLTFDDRGRHHLRGVDDAWDLYAVSA